MTGGKIFVEEFSMGSFSRRIFESSAKATSYPDQNKFDLQDDNDVDDYDDIDEEEPTGNICKRTGIGHYCYSLAAPYSQPGSDSPTMAYEGGLAAGFAAVQ